ncbi:MAG: hypothetical protein JWR61_1930 [Ferruginibacter sp.]|nr:hypothetical protein [Ferruginibacter sp.]
MPSVGVGGNEKNPRFFSRSVNTETAISATPDEQQAGPFFYINEVLVSYEALRKFRWKVLPWLDTYLRLLQWPQTTGDVWVQLPCI